MNRDKKTVYLDIYIDQAGELDRFIGGIERFLKDKRLLARLIQRAASETVLMAVRKRYLQNLPKALEMEASKTDMAGRKLSATKSRGVQHIQPYLDTWSELAEQLNAAHLDGDQKRVLAVQARMADFRERMIDKLNTDQQGVEHNPTWSTLSTRRFRPRALEILDHLTNAAAMSVEFGEGGSVTVGFGSRKHLDQIKTPSAILYVFKKKPASPYNILWRHLEFGTGAYATDPVGKTHANTQWSAGGGYWKLPVGQRKGGSTIVFKGSRGVHALRDATGVMYDEDTVRFTAYLGVALQKAIWGS